MPRALAHYMPREMAALGVIECALSFAVIYAMIGAVGVSGSLPAVFLAPRVASVASAALLTVGTGAIAVAIGLYRLDVCLDCKRQLAAILVAVAVAFAILSAVGHGNTGGGIMGASGPALRLYVTKVLLGWVGVLTVIRLGYGYAMIRMPRSRRIAVLGDSQLVERLSARLRSRRGKPFDLVSLDDQDMSWQSLRRQRIRTIVLLSAPEPDALEPLLACKLLGTRVMDGAAFQEDCLGRIDLDTVTADALLLGRGFTNTQLSAAIKRVCDLGIAAFMLILMLPLMALTALAIKIDSPGPVFYCQERVGRFDKPFKLFKFRSMAVDAEAGGNPRWAETKDPRVTRVGRFIRTTRIDELPQLVNVLGGNMSLVGPRPERPHFVRQLELAIPLYRQRAFVKPGLTGWAQVNYPYGASVEDAREKLSYDLFYVKNRTILLDLVILLSTIRVVLFREGAR